jgi:hypothetical protein
MINIFIIGFINNFNLNNYKNHLFVTNNMIFNNDILNSDIIISFCNITKKDYDILIEQKLLKKTIIFHLNEPRQKFSKYALELYNNNFFDYIFGCVNTIYKYPKYIIPLHYNNLKEKNDYVKSINIEQLLLKNKFLFCSDGEKSLVNKINEQINIANFNDFNIILNKNHIFSICSELHDCTSSKISSITLGCAIPIFNGILDSIDEQIFNKNRILFYDSNNIESINMCIEKINELLNDNTKLLNFYKQDIFLLNSRNTINTMISNIKNIFISEEEKIINKKELVQVVEAVVEPVPVTNQVPEQVPEAVVEKKEVKKQTTYSKKTLLKLRH